MTSTKPYLIRAFYDWIVENSCTPYIVINANLPYVEVPAEYIESGQIVLNISVTAVNGLVLGNKAIEFQARFGGKVRKIYAPINSILAIYAKENGRGMVFAEDELEEEAQLPGDSESAEGAEGAGAAGDDAEGNAGAPAGDKSRKQGAEKRSFETIEGSSGDDKGKGGSGGKGKGKGGKPSHLTVIK